MSGRAAMPLRSGTSHAGSTALATVGFRLRATQTEPRARSARRERALFAADPGTALSELFGLPKNMSGSRCEIAVPLSGPTCRALADLVAGHPLRLLTVAAATSALVLSRYSRREDLLIATPAPATADEAVAPVWLPARRGETAGRLLARMAAELREALGCPAVSNQMRALIQSDGSAVGVAAVYLPGRQSAPDVELAVAAGFRGGDPYLRVEVETARVDTGTAERVARHLARVCGLLVEDPDRMVEEIAVLDEPETAAVLRRCSGAPVTQEPELFHRRVRRHAAERPDHTAVVSGDRRVSYAALYQAGRVVADRLVGAGVQAGDRVAILLDRSDLPVAAVLGAFLAEAVYVPVDPAYPDARIRHMVADCGAAAVVTEPSLRHRVPDGFDGTVHALKPVPELALCSAPDREGAEAGAAAYAIYTSGTTGEPKAALISHGAYASTCSTYRTGLGLSPDEVCLQLGSFAFDMFNADLGLSVYQGGTLVIVPDALRADPDSVAELVAAHRATIVENTPAFINPLVESLSTRPEALRALRVLICGADAWRVEDFRKARALLGPRVRVFNCYGVTEAAVDATLFCAEDEAILGDLPYVPIGKPIPGVTIRVVDPVLRLMPDGLAGELCLGGRGVGAGYLGRDELTAQRFVADPYAAGASLYRTGDLVRILTSGHLEFLGRVDHQVKIRGYRVELGEVESAIRGHRGVREAVAVVRDDGQGSASLVAYIVYDGPPPSAADLRELCEMSLPPYMVPSAFVPLAAVPLTHNGKVDRSALPAADRGRVASGTAFVAPRDELEQVVADAWAQVLGVAEVGVEDDFFDLGGHSLHAVRIQAKLADAVGTRIELHAIFEQPTVAALARVIRVARADGRAAVRAMPPLRRFEGNGYEDD